MATMVERAELLRAAQTVHTKADDGGLDLLWLIGGCGIAGLAAGYSMGDGVGALTGSIISSVIGALLLVTKSP